MDNIKQLLDKTFTRRDELCIATVVVTGYVGMGKYKAEETEYYLNHDKTAKVFIELINYIKENKEKFFCVDLNIYESEEFASEMLSKFDLKIPASNRRYASTIDSLTIYYRGYVYEMLNENY